VALRGRDSNRERIYNWRIEGSNDSVNYTAIFTAPNPAYLDILYNTFQLIPQINLSIIDCTA